MSVAIATDAVGKEDRTGAVSVRRNIGVGAVFTLAGAGMLLIASRIATGALPYPGCGFKHLTGLACPGCGGVRGLCALTEGRVGDAFDMNPMAVALCLALVSAFPFAVLDGVFNRGRGARRLGRWLEHRHLGWIMAGVLAANWVYLLVVGR